jgi:subtilisin family serine protease
MSMGGTAYASEAACDEQEPARKAVIDRLRSVSIASIASSGNEGLTDLITAPGCISSVISVGATTKAGEVATFSNSADFLSLLAPGRSIRTSDVDSSYAIVSGSSMSAPHVAGAWAILRHATPVSNISQILLTLQTTGMPIVDDRNGVTVSEIRLMAAIDSLKEQENYEPTDARGIPLPLPASDDSCGLVGLEMLLPLLLVRALRRRRGHGSQNH